MNDALLALGRGAIVAAPTESFFGLLVDATDARAVDNLLREKARPQKGAPILLPNRESWAALVQEVPPAAARLADAFWPGPLTIALASSSVIDPRLDLDDTIAVRLPGPCIAAELTRRHGRPLTATSANPTGEPPAVSADQVNAWFPRAIAAGRMFVLGESAPGGAVSTVVSIAGSGVVIVRDGAISAERIHRALAGKLLDV